MGIAELKEKCRLAVEQAKTGTLPKSPATLIGINPPAPAAPSPPAPAPPAPAPAPAGESLPSVVTQNSPAPNVKKSPAELLAAFRKSVAAPVAPVAPEPPAPVAPEPPAPAPTVAAPAPAPKPAKKIVLKKAPTPVDLSGLVGKPVTQSAPAPAKPAEVIKKKEPAEVIKSTDAPEPAPTFLIGTLFIDCMPVGAYTVNLFSIVNVVGPQVAAAAGEVHWSCLPYGTGPGVLQAALEAYLNSISWSPGMDVFVMSDTKEGMALKGYLMTIARSVVVGLK